MPAPDAAQERTGRWRPLGRQSGKWRWRALPWGVLLGFVAGILFWGGFNTALEATNTEEFCISCHEMRDNVYQEYMQTAHYRNRAGVRATCPDCHVPRPWVYKVVRKVRATHELLHKFAGTIDTKEKFEAHRLELARQVWATMKSTDSRECRNCHAQVYMDIERQDRSAHRKHSFDYLRESGETCIDCHKGVAHHLPAGADDED